MTWDPVWEALVSHASQVVYVLKMMTFLTNTTTLGELHCDRIPL